VGFRRCLSTQSACLTFQSSHGKPHRDPALAHAHGLMLHQPKGVCLTMLCACSCDRIESLHKPEPLALQLILSRL
jgi:hypothetical protein